jgi:hypothetical protein
MCKNLETAVFAHIAGSHDSFLQAYHSLPASMYFRLQKANYRFNKKAS